MDSSEAISSNEAVYVIDDDTSVRTSLGRLLRSVGLDTQTYPSVAEFLSRSSPDPSGCLILDVRMPGMTGLEFQQKMDVHGMRVPIVFMTGFGDIPMSVRGMKAGAVDFLTKPFRDHEMLDAVGRALDLDRRRRALEDARRDLATRYDALSRREREVLWLVTTGKMNKQVAGELGLSDITVKVHRASVMKKLKAASLAELVRMADALRPTASHQLLSGNASARE